MTGVFEILNPLLTAFDWTIGWMPSAVRVLVWGALAGAASMSLYKSVSPQDSLRELARQSREAQGGFKDAPTHAGLAALFRTSGKRLFLTLPPTLASSLPVLFALAFLNANYDLALPAPGVPVAVLSEDGDAIRVEGGQRFAEGWTVSWPEPGENVRVFDAAERHVYSLSADTQPGVARQSGLTAYLMGAQAGLIEPGSGVERLEIFTAPQDILQPGLRLRYQWIFPFLLSLMATSLLIKARYEIA